jgi:hypothetical protein
MESFKQRMQPTLDAMPAGQDKQTLQALIDYQDALTQPTVLPQDRMRLFREVVRAQRHAAVPGKV